MFSCDFRIMILEQCLEYQSFTIIGMLKLGLLTQPTLSDNKNFE